jgi:hypothetical protein
VVATHLHMGSASSCWLHLLLFAGGCSTAATAMCSAALLHALSFPLLLLVPPARHLLGNRRLPPC